MCTWKYRLNGVGTHTKSVVNETNSTETILSPHMRCHCLQLGSRHFSLFDDVNKQKLFPRHWPFLCAGISPVTANCDVATSLWRDNDVIVTSCVYWGATIILIVTFQRNNLVFTMPLKDKFVDHFLYNLNENSPTDYVINVGIHTDSVFGNKPFVRSKYVITQNHGNFQYPTTFSCQSIGFWHRENDIKLFWAVYMSCLVTTMSSDKVFFFSIAWLRPDAISQKKSIHRSQSYYSLASL